MQLNLNRFKDVLTQGAGLKCRISVGDAYVEEEVRTLGEVFMFVAGVAKTMADSLETPEGMFRNFSQVVNFLTDFEDMTEEELAAASRKKLAGQASPGRQGFYPLKKEIRAARNSPCPCGSGKKFKKCCIGK